jgi:RNA polymerase sigma factor (sigma-70 family)
VSVTETPPDGSGWSEALGANPGSSVASRRCGTSTDEQLARAAGRGDVAAFEALYERYHLHLLSFSRHMVGGVHDAEDVVQHTFMAADRTFRSGKPPKAVRAWLYTVARNRCISVLRARRDEHDLPDAGVPSTENLAADVEQRADLRELLADLRTLPDDQRAALLLSELGDLSHAEVAAVIGVRAGKVKALVFQARQRLMAAADARSIPCHAIREEIAVATGAALRRRHLRNHLAQCEDCSAFSARVRAQRASVAAILPVVPTIALRDSVLGALGSGGAAAAGAGGAGAGLGMLAAKSTAVKVLTIVAIGGGAAGGGAVAVNAVDSSRQGRSADRSAEQVRSPTSRTDTAPAGVAPGVAAADPRLRVGPAGARGGAAPDRSRGADGREKGARGRDDRESSPGRDTAPGQAKPKDKASEPPGSRGRAVGHAKQQARDKPTPPGKAKQEARTKPAPAGKAKQEARAKVTPRGQAQQEAAPAPKAKVPAEKPAPPVKAEEPVSPAPAVAPAEPAVDAKSSNGNAIGQQAEAEATPAG